jgi:hypothetical protein
LLRIKFDSTTVFCSLRTLIDIKSLVTIPCKAHKKELEALAVNEPAKPKILGVKKWRADHGAWESERDKLLESIRSDLESLGVRLARDRADMGKEHREAEARHERIKEYAAGEALRLQPGAAAIIREDDVRRDREERERREVEEARARIEKENYKRFRSSIRELAAKFGKDALIVTNAQDGRIYDVSIIGLVEKNGHHYAAQMMYGGHVILHNVEKEDLSKIASIVGKKVEIKCLDGCIGAIAEERGVRERSRSWSR